MGGIDRVICGLCDQWIEQITDDPTARGFTLARYALLKGKDFEDGDEILDDDDGGV
jgi:hypothetical protein